MEENKTQKYKLKGKKLCDTHKQLLTHITLLKEIQCQPSTSENQK